jgi:hypothetical protein
MFNEATAKKCVAGVCNLYKFSVNFSDLTYIFLLLRCDPTRVMASSFTRFLDHTQRCITVGKTPLDE